MNAGLAEKGQEQSKELARTDKERLALVSEIKEETSKKEKERERLLERLASEAEEDLSKTLQLLRAPSVTKPQPQDKDTSLGTTKPEPQSKEPRNQGPDTRKPSKHPTRGWAWKVTFLGLLLIVTLVIIRMLGVGKKTKAQPVLKKRASQATPSDLDGQNPKLQPEQRTKVKS